MATPTENDERNDERLKKLFVGGLKRDTLDETLKGYFEAYGELSDCVVIRENETKKSRGFGYVTFSNKDDILEVLKDKKEKGAHSIDGKEVEVKRAIPRDDSSTTAHLKTKKIFIGGLADEATAEDIKQALADEIRGTLPTSVDLIMKKNEDGTTSTNKHRGFCFVEFEDEDIVDELCCIKKVNVCGKVVEIKKAEPKDKDKGGPGGRGGRGGGGRGGYGAGRGRGRGGGGDFGGGGYGGYQAGGYNESYGYGATDYGYNYGAYGGGAGGYDNYGGMGMAAYQQAPSGYGPQGGYGQGGGRGGARYRPY